MAREKKNFNALANQMWTIWVNEGDRGTTIDVDQLQILLLMEVREQLKKLNGLLHCERFVGIPGKLERIVKNTSKPRKRKRKAVG